MFNNNSFFLFLSGVPLCGIVYLSSHHNLFIKSLTDGHMCCLQFLAIIQIKVL